MSSRPSASTSGRPSTTSGGKIQIPSALSPVPSSASEHNMPSDTTPRNSARSMRMPSGSLPPGLTTGTACPSATLGAPVTIVSSSMPVRTRTTVKCSADGCAWTSTTLPTTMSSKPTAIGSIISTNKPAIVIRSASSSTVQGMST